MRNPAPILFAVAIASAGAVALGHAQGQTSQKSGIDRSSFDPSVRPQDDFFRYVNGGWFAQTEIPPDHTSIGSFVDLHDDAERHVRTLIEELAKGARPPGSPQPADRRPVRQLHGRGGSREPRRGAARAGTEQDRRDQNEGRISPGASASWPTWASAA